MLLTASEAPPRCWKTRGCCSASVPFPIPTRQCLYWHATAEGDTTNQWLRGIARAALLAGSRFGKTPARRGASQSGYPDPDQSRRQ